MTTEEAINRLKYDREMCYFNPSTGVAGEPYDEDCKEMAQALDIAIRALEHKPSVNDCVSRQTALDFIKDHSYPVRYDGNSIEQGMTLTGIEQALNEVPSVQPEQKTMRWIDVREQCGEFMCSNCQFLCCTNQYSYCPDCGAKRESEAG